MADHHQQQPESLESEEGSPPAKRARLDPSTGETSGNLVGAKVGLAKDMGYILSLSLMTRLDS